jgi:hypothetical protein
MQSKFNKLSTNWLPMAGRNAIDKPRFATEDAIFKLRRLAFTDQQWEDEGVMGAEWWCVPCGCGWCTWWCVTNSRRMTVRWEPNGE